MIRLGKVDGEKFTLTYLWQNILTSSGARVAQMTVASFLPFINFPDAFRHFNQAIEDFFDEYPQTFDLMQ